MSVTVLYGIAHCDTVKRAREWLADQRVAYEFHDLKKAGLTPTRLASWVAVLGWEALLNRRGSTWRRLDPAAQQIVSDAPNAQALMLAQTSVIKRPVMEWAGGTITVGFDGALWTQLVALKPRQ